MRLEGSVAPHVVRGLSRLPAREIERRIVEQIARADKLSFVQLKAGRDHTGRTVEARWRRLGEANGHERPAMRTAHPPLDEVREGKGLQRFHQERGTLTGSG